MVTYPNPWTPDETAILRQLLEGRQYSHTASQLSPRQVPKVYYDLLRGAQVDVGQLYYRLGRSHDFVLYLKNPDEESLHRAYGCEIELQGRVPLHSLNFDFRFAPLTEQEEAELLLEQGFQLYDIK